jgi:hypothetical protein
VTTLGAIGVTNGANADAEVTIRNNTIDNIAGARGISYTADGGANKLLITANSIDNLGSTSKSAINVNFINNATLGTAGNGSVTVSNNSVGMNGSTAGHLWTAGSGTANGILLQALNGANMTAAITSNSVDANTTSVIEVVRVRAASTTGNPGGTVNATVNGNAITDTDTATAHVEFDATAGTSLLAGTVNLTISANILPPGSGVIQFTDNAAGAMHVTQANSAAVASANGGVTVNVTGSPVYGSGSPPSPALPSLPLLSNTTGDPSHPVHAITMDELASVTAAAANRWEHLPLSGAQLQALSNIAFTIGNLGPGNVGAEAPGLVVLDVVAGGAGWYVDATPMDDAEFAGSAGSRLYATDPAAAGQMDLLTAVMHEMGHAIGLSDAYGAAQQGDVMSGVLAPGERHVPTSADLDAVTLVGIGLVGPGSGP